VKILLVGGLGFIGKRFARRFSDVHNIIIFDLKDDINRAGKITNKKIILEEGSIEDKKIDESISKHSPDAVIHLAALTGLKKCHENPKEAFLANVYGTFNVLNACIKAHSKLIFFSSREVYGETLSGQSSEDDPLAPNNTYGITKMIGENLVRYAGEKNNLDFTILRLTNVYGPGGGTSMGLKL